MSRTLPNIPVNQLREMFELDVNTGELTWKAHKNDLGRSHPGFVGTVAGTLVKRVTGQGHITYVGVKIKGVRYKAHRIVWAMYTGKWPLPGEDIDHINGVGTDNRPSNLRCVTHEENMKNQALRVTNTSGTNGVCWCKNNKYWRVRFTANRKRICGGNFKDLADAVAKAKELRSELGFNQMHGQARDLRADD